MIEPSHRMAVPGRKNRLSLRAAVIFFALLLCSLRARPDEPYARTRDYDLQHSRIALRFDIDQRKVHGDVTHEISMLRDNTPKISFDAVGLTVHSVVVNKSPAKFETTASRLIVSLPGTPHIGDTFQIEILYEGKPTKGLYFILPDKDDPTRPIQIWTQGESEDTRFYLPTYDYPNDRLTTETILTVPAKWVTVANGKLISVIDAGNTQKTWTWRESQPSSTYLITVVAGEFDEVKQSLRGLPVTYYAPKGRGDRLLPNYERTPAMIELFNKKLAVEYPWEKYAQVMVDDFVAGGMENSSATTNTSDSLRSPKLIPEYPTNEDALISHELAHQWFGDLVTCKDWANIWLNEGFATFFETVWSESHYPKDQAKYDTWKTAREWFMKSDLYEKPIVRRDFEESEEFDGNAYEKAGWVLYMLRHQLGDDAFWRSLKHTRCSSGWRIRYSTPSWILVTGLQSMTTGPTLSWPADHPTARWATVTSSVSPDRADTMVAQPWRRAVSRAARARVRVPVWLGLTSKAFVAPAAAAASTRPASVTRKSSPTTWIRSPTAAVNAAIPAVSCSATGSSMETIG